MDATAIEPGLPFEEVINEAVGRCDVLIAMIGNQWLQARPGLGPRIADNEDFVRLEIAAALRRDIRVIPVLLDGTVMPRAEDLPASIRGLSSRHALDLRNGDFETDMAKLVAAIDKVLKIRDGVAKGQTSRLLQGLSRRTLLAGFATGTVLFGVALAYWTSTDVCSRLDGRAINIAANGYRGIVGPNGIKLDRVGLWDHRFTTDIVFSMDAVKNAWGVLRNPVTGECHSNAGTISFARTLGDKSVERYRGRLLARGMSMAGTFDSGNEEKLKVPPQWSGDVVDLSGN